MTSKPLEFPEDSETHRLLEVNRLLLEALSLPPDERSEFLESSCPDDSALRREVDALLSIGTSTLEDLESPGVEWRPSGEDGAGPRRLGAYELKREIGRGGMGEVYLAIEVADQRPVAIKLLKRGLDSDEIVRRFRRERRILAHLEHPNIARLYDGGHSEDHRPYLVMEWVDGESVDRYCDRHRLSINERLSLFSKIAQAVGFAHRNLVVHRDLKPSNVLVTSDGEPKLLDFGIAKLLESGEPDTVALTSESGPRWMTPQYASPEQVRGEPISTASDVYSLGVLLYELLCGYRPYQLTGCSESEARRVICDTAPPLPSRRLGAALEDTAAWEAIGEAPSERSPMEVASTRGSLEPSTLCRMLRGDLDSIVAKAMSQDLADRYASVEQLLADIDRYLAGEPVHARRHTWTYRTGKFIRRNRLRLGATAVVMAIFGAYLVEREHGQQQIALERDRAQEVTQFLEELFQVSHPSTVQPLPTTRELLDRGAERVERELVGEPELQAALMITIGKVYRNLGLYEPSEKMLSRALELKESVYGTTHREYAMALHEFGKLRQGQGRFGEAVTALQQALDSGGLDAQEDCPQSANLQVDLAVALHDQGELEAAEQLLREAVATIQQLRGDKHLDLVRAWTELMIVLNSNGKFEEAETLIRRALDVQSQLLGPENLEVTRTMNLLGRVLTSRGQHAAAGEQFERVLEVRRTILGEDHREVAAAHNNVALVAQDAGDYETAAVGLGRAVEILSTHLEPEHPQLLLGQQNLAMVRLELGDFEGAETLVRHVIAGLRPTENPVLSLALRRLAAILAAQGDFAPAVERVEEAIALDAKLLTDDHPFLAMPWQELALLLYFRDPSVRDPSVRTPAAQGQYTRVVELLGRAQKYNRDSLPPGHVDIVRNELFLIMIDLDQGRVDQAVQRVETLRDAGEGLKAWPWLWAYYHSVLGATLAASGDLESGEALLREHHRTVYERYSKPPGLRRWATEQLIAIYERQGRSAEAVDLRASIE